MRHPPSLSSTPPSALQPDNAAQGGQGTGMISAQCFVSPASLSVPVCTLAAASVDPRGASASLSALVPPNPPSPSPRGASASTPGIWWALGEASLRRASLAEVFGLPTPPRLQAATSVARAAGPWVWGRGGLAWRELVSWGWLGVHPPAALGVAGANGRFKTSGLTAVQVLALKRPRGLLCAGGGGRLEPWALAAGSSDTFAR